MAITLSTPSQVADFVARPYESQRGSYSVYDIARINQAVLTFTDLQNDACLDPRAEEDVRNSLFRFQKLLDKMKRGSE